MYNNNEDPLFRTILDNIQYRPKSALKTFQAYKQWKILQFPLIYGISAITAYLIIKNIQSTISKGLKFNPFVEFLRPITAFMNTNKDIVNHICKQILYVVLPIGNTIALLSIVSKNAKEKAIIQFRYHYFNYTPTWGSNEKHYNDLQIEFENYYNKVKQKNNSNKDKQQKTISDTLKDNLPGFKHNFWPHCLLELHIQRITRFVNNLADQPITAAIFSSFENTKTYHDAEICYNFITNVIFETEIPEHLKINKKDFENLKKKYNINPQKKIQIEKNSETETNLQDIQKILLYLNNKKYKSAKLKFNLCSIIKLGVIISLIVLFYYISSVVEQIENYGIKSLNFIHFFQKYNFFEKIYIYLVVNPDHFITFSRFFQSLPIPLIIIFIIQSIFNDQNTINFIYNTNNHIIVKHSNFNNNENTNKINKIIENLNEIYDGTYKAFFDFITKPLC